MLIDVLINFGVFNDDDAADTIDHVLAEGSCLISLTGVLIALAGPEAFEAFTLKYSHTPLGSLLTSHPRFAFTFEILSVRSAGDAGTYSAVASSAFAVFDQNQSYVKVTPVSGSQSPSYPQRNEPIPSPPSNPVVGDGVAVPLVPPDLGPIN